MQIYVHRNNQQLGPFTEAEIKAQLSSGGISPQDHIWWQGQPGWVPLAQSSLMATLASSSPESAALPPGQLPGTPGVVAMAAPTSKLAIWALVCGCLGFFISLFASIPAIILGHMGLNQIKKNPGMQGRGMAMTGLILGYIFTLLLPIISIIAISVLIALGNQVKSTFKTVQTEEEQRQEATSNSDQTTNAPDQSAPSPALTNGPDQSANSAPANTNAPDDSTNAVPALTNAPDASTNNTAPDTNSTGGTTNAAPMSQ